MSSSIVVALLGSAAMAVLAFGLWLPAYLRHRALSRRLTGFVQADTATGFAMDLGGRRRTRTNRRATDERGRWVIRQVARMIVQAQVDVSIGEVFAAMAILGLLAFTLTVILWGASSWLFSTYVRTLARYATLYGSLAAVAIVLFWLWLLSLAVLIGGAVNAELSGLLDAPSEPASGRLR